MGRPGGVVDSVDNDRKGLEDKDICLDSPADVVGTLVRPALLAYACVGVATCTNKKLLRR